MAMLLVCCVKGIYSPDSTRNSSNDATLSDSGSASTCIGTPEATGTVWKWAGFESEPDRTAYGPWPRQAYFQLGGWGVTGLGVDNDRLLVATHGGVLAIQGDWSYRLFEEPAEELHNIPYPDVIIAEDGRLLVATVGGAAWLVDGTSPTELVAGFPLGAPAPGGLLELDDGTLLLGRSILPAVAQVTSDGEVLQVSTSAPDTGLAEGNLWNLGFEALGVPPDRRMAWRDGRILLTDRTYGLREVDPETWIATLVPGAERPGWEPSSVAVDRDGVIYLAGASFDPWGDACVRRIFRDGTSEDVTLCDFGVDTLPTRDGQAASEVSFGVDFNLMVEVIEPYLFIAANHIVYRVRIRE